MTEKALRSGISWAAQRQCKAAETRTECILSMMWAQDKLRAAGAAHLAQFLCTSGSPA